MHPYIKMFIEENKVFDFSQLKPGRRIKKICKYFLKQAVSKFNIVYTKTLAIRQHQWQRKSPVLSRALTSLKNFWKNSGKRYTA